MKKLLIVESPAKVKTISKFLGPDFIVVSTVGHIKDLPIKSLGLDIKKNFTIEPIYEVMPKKEEVIKNIQSKVKHVGEVFLAPDPDREGEAIAQHAKEIVEDVAKKGIIIRRITFNEITQKAILESINNPRQIDEHLVQAQQARRILDRLVGYQVSPILWRKVGHGLSAGRVQSVALKLVCIREEEIKNFVIKEYWSIHPVLIIETNNISTTLIKFRDKKVDDVDPKDVEHIVSELKKEKEWKITDVKEGKRSKKPYAPFITSTLQQAAYNQLGFNVSQTMTVAQKLYEGVDILGDTKALITYMRTDSARLSDEALKDIRSLIKKSFGEKYLPKSALVYGKKQAAQDAHEAIRPVDVSITPESLKGKIDKNQYQLYTLVWNRAVASQMESAEYLTRNISFESSKKDVCKLAGSTLIFDGFLRLYNEKTEEPDEGTLPPDLDKTKTYILNKVDSKQHFTQPPARYSEATLVKELEHRGIGRPSTYSAILRTIKDREYTRLDDKKRFVPTEKGNIVSAVLEENFTEIMDFNFTAGMEEDLDKIAEGNKTRDDIISHFYKNFSAKVTQFSEKKIDRNFRETTIECPQDGCGKLLCVKLGKNGEFLACPSYPECKFTSNFTTTDSGEIILVESVKKETQLLDEICPNCGKNMMQRSGRYGDFVACSGYPDCKYIQKKETKAKCPECKKNTLSERKWKGSTFWGCQGYPDCKYRVSGDIVEQPCTNCSSPFMKMNKKGEITCADKECGTTKNDKVKKETKEPKKSTKVVKEPKAPKEVKEKKKKE